MKGVGFMTFEEACKQKAHEIEKISKSSMVILFLIIMKGH